MQCRACKRFNCVVATDMSSVVPTDGKTLYDYFNDCTQLEAKARDDLPQVLCMTCTKHLKQAYGFREVARRSDDELRRTLALSKNETLMNLDPEQDTDFASIARLLTMSPKREAEFIYPEDTQSLDDNKTAASDPLSVPIKNESIDLDKITELFEALEDDTAPISEPIILEPCNPLTTMRENVHIASSNTIKEEIEIEIDMAKQTSKGQCDEPKKKVKRRNRKNPKSKPHKIFKCNFCVFKSELKHALKEHVFQLHKETILCHDCSKVFQLPEEMAMHKKLVHEMDSDMRCPWCLNSNSMPKDELAKHLQTKHACVYHKYFPRVHEAGRIVRPPLECEHCLKIFKSIYELADHIHEHKFDCAICSKTFRTNKSYKTHLKRIHNQSARSLKAKLTASKEDAMPFNCSICRMQFTLEKYRNRHMYNKHKESISNSENDNNSVDELQFQNDSSGKETRIEIERLYETSTSVDIEIKPGRRPREHDKLSSNKLKNEKKFICAYCPREFKRSTYVKLHEQKIHQSETLVRKKCPICEKLLDPRYLNLHIKSLHNNDRKFECDVCGNTYKTKSQLASHKYLHLDRKHLCTVCNKGFTSASLVKVHMRSHTGEKPFACHLCDERFRIRVRLTYHLQRHAGITHKCYVCGKEYNDIKLLKAHSYTHTGMPYRCPLCKFKSSGRDKFRKHLLGVHKKILTEDELSEMFKANTGRFARAKTVQETGTSVAELQEKDHSN